VVINLKRRRLSASPSPSPLARAVANDSIPPIRSAREAVIPSPITLSKASRAERRRVFSPHRRYWLRVVCIKWNTTFRVWGVGVPFYTDGLA